jgi:Fic family protein
MQNPDMKSGQIPGQKPAQTAPVDRGEPISRMEPLRIAEGSRHRGELADLTLDLATRSARFQASLPPGLARPLADAVRAMNCYYSNLIEGHDTHPIDIERALKKDYSADAKKRDLQLEAVAHIAVQKWMDGGALNGNAFSAAAAREIHRRFCEHLPDDLLQAEDPKTAERVAVEPGEYRRRDVKVGNHVPVSPGAIARFMQRFEEAFGRLGRAEAILATAGAHQRVLWIHPFLDGNGRVARLMSHAQLLEFADSGAVWSVARGLARNVDRYQELIANCDLQRRNDLDGRGNLSEEALAEFTKFFLNVCIDQVTFMETLMQPEQLRARVLIWAEEEIRLGRLPARADRLLEVFLYRGQIARSEGVSLLGMAERTARRISSALVQRGVLTSESPKAPLTLAFPATLAGRWMPGLFPERPSR